jgi:hypothetical protein
MLDNLLITIVDPTCIDAIIDALRIWNLNWHSEMDDRWSETRQKEFHDTVFQNLFPIRTININFLIEKYVQILKNWEKEWKKEINSWTLDQNQRFKIMIKEYLNPFIQKTQI